MYKSVPKNYGWVLLLATLNTGTVMADKLFSNSRKQKIFSSPLLMPFHDIYKKATGELIADNGLPDNGIGRISAQLPYKEQAELGIIHMRSLIHDSHWRTMIPCAVFF